jgi:bacterioferritin
MQGDAKVIEYLNKGLRHELTAINQYWLHYRLLANWGLSDMAKVWRKESIEEMQHADRITDRIIFLEGFPKMQMLDPLRIGQNVKEIIDCDLAAEMSACAVPRGGDVLSFRERLCHPRPVREPDDGRGTPHRFPRDAA